jgi:putative endonuclease
MRDHPLPDDRHDRQDERRALGAEGETRAARFLARRGYRIEARNVRLAGVEVDLIAKRGALVVFVEVKTRRGEAQGGPELAVDAAKQARLVRAASAWLREHPGRARRLRFDVVACRAHASGRWQIDHWPGAFEA